MARTQKKDAKIGENYILGAAMGIAAITVVVFLVLLLVSVLSNDKIEEEDKYENYIHLTTTQFENLIKIHNGAKDSFGHLIQYEIFQDTSSSSTDPDRNKLYNTLIECDVVYVLVFSSTNNLGRDDDAINEAMGKQIQDNVINVISHNSFDITLDEQAYRACFLIYDYKDATSSALASFYSLLAPKLTDPNYYIDWKRPYETQAGVLSPWLVTFKTQEASSKDKKETYVVSGYKGSTIDYFNQDLIPAIKAIKESV